MSDELNHFVYRALAKGVSRERIVGLLTQAGWSEQAAVQALSAYADLDCPEPVPRPRRYVSAADTITQLGRFAALYIWIGVWLWLLFRFVDLSYPDGLDDLSHSAYISSGMHWAIASLAIAYPLYLWLSYVTRRSLKDDPERRRSRMHSWLIWLTLFVTAAALLGDLASLLYHFLGGDLGIRFILRTLIVGVVAAGLFVHYRAALATDAGVAGAALANPIRWIGPAATVALLASVAAAFWIAGGPGLARDRAADRRRVDDLQAIERAVTAYQQDTHHLPGDLRVLREAHSGPGLDIADPLTGDSYQYTTSDTTHYRLCATFDVASRRHVSGRWQHGRGTHCFALKADAAQD